MRQPAGERHEALRRVGVVWARGVRFGRRRRCDRDRGHCRERSARGHPGRAARGPAGAAATGQSQPARSRSSRRRSGRRCSLARAECHGARGLRGRPGGLRRGRGRRRRPGPDPEPRQLRRLPPAAGHRRHQSGGQPPARVREQARRHQRGAAIPEPQRADPRGALRPQCRRQPGRRRARALHHCRSKRCVELQLAAAGLRGCAGQPERGLPDPHAGLRRRADRTDPRPRHPRQPGGQRQRQAQPGHPRARQLRAALARDLGAAEQERQRRHARALRVEGAEQVAAGVLRRGLQRRDGHHQRRCSPPSATRPRRASTPRSPTAAPTWTRPRPRPASPRSRSSRCSCACSRRRGRRPTSPVAASRSPRARRCSHRGLRAVPHAVAAHRQRTFAGAALPAGRTCTPTCCCTTWAARWPTA